MCVVGDIIVRRPMLTGILLAFLQVPGSSVAQVVLDRSERLDSERPEAWAMAYMSSATLFSGFGVPQYVEPSSLSMSLEAAHIPRLNREQRRVGFDGTKLEDLNKSPVFGRLRLTVGLPDDFTLEFGWTPPVRVAGARPRQLVGLAVERPLHVGPKWRLGGRVFYQRGQVRGDFTCDRDTASHEPGSAANPFGCRAPSRDRFNLDQYGFELAIAPRMQGQVEPFLAYTHTRMKPEVRVHAEVFGIVDRALLSSRLTTHTTTVGIVIRAGEWNLLGAVAWTPLHVQRAGDSGRDDLHSARMILRRDLR